MSTFDETDVFPLTEAYYGGPRSDIRATGDRFHGFRVSVTYFGGLGSVWYRPTLKSAERKAERELRKAKSEDARRIARQNEIGATA